MKMAIILLIVVPLTLLMSRNAVGRDRTEDSP